MIGQFLILVGSYSMIGPLWSISTAFFTGRSAAGCHRRHEHHRHPRWLRWPYWMGFAKDLTGDYQRGLLLTAPFMLFAAAIMLYLRAQSNRSLICVPVSGG